MGRIVRAGLAPCLALIAAAGALFCSAGENADAPASPSGINRLELLRRSVAQDQGTG